MDHQHQSSSRKLGGGGSATSSSIEEINNEGLERDRTTKRCYECRFGKRGFTNSQALNGHMKIHRRDRGKAAMQAPTNPSSRNKNPDSNNHVGPTIQSPTNYHDDADHLNLMSSRFNYPVLEAQRVSTTNSKRSYECTFCKRGFTNGQALGGHMSIHRRDLGKAAKQAPTNPSSRNKNPDSYDHVGPTNQSPSNYHDDADHLNRMPSWGADLSLRTGSSNNNQVEEEIENVELDSELRLGHHP